MFPFDKDSLRPPTIRTYKRRGRKGNNQGQLNLLGLWKEYSDVGSTGRYGNI